MSHWFDDFTKNLASAGSVPRRSFLQLIGAAAGTKLLEGIPLAGLLAGTPFGSRAFAAPGECAWRTTGTAKVNEVSLNQGGISFHQLISYDVAQQTGALSASLTKGDALFVKIELAGKRGGSLTGSANYGSDVQGAKNATIKSRDGKSFEGEMDGRAFTVRDRQMVFADGQPAPTITVEPNLRATLQTLLGEAAESLAVCPAAPKPPAPTQPRTRGWLAAPGADWYEPLRPGPACDECEQGCGDTYAAQVDKGNVSGWLCFISIACLASAFAEWLGCMGICNLPGGGCLPNPCGSFTTCAPGDQCYSYKDGKLCCPAPAAVCQGVCCGKGVTSCLPDGSCGCSSEFNQIQCGNNCCDGKKQVCADGICCPIGQVNFNGKCCLQKNICGSVCCDELSKCADPKTGLCCPFSAPVCGGKCCKPGEQCIDGKCCSKPCGNTCCGAGQECQNGKCVSIACPSGQVTCISKEGPDKQGAAICCPPNVACCLGKCCKPGELCCSGPGTPFGCHDPNLCIA